MSAVCNDQDTFNKSFRGAIKSIEKKERPGKTAMVIATVIYVLFVVWALTLASRVPNEEKTEHMMFAILFSPAYVLSYYIGNMSN